LNHCKRKRAEPSRLIPQKLTVSLELICANVLDHCVRNEAFRDELKLANVSPVFKCGAKDFVSDERPSQSYLTFPKYIISYRIRSWLAF